MNEDSVGPQSGQYKPSGPQCPLCHSGHALLGNGPQRPGPVVIADVGSKDGLR